MPFISCIVLSHNKPIQVVEAIASLISQQWTDWEAIVFDSGVLFDQGFYQSIPAMADPRVRLVRSWETEELRQTMTIASWCFNECFRRRMVRGQFVTYLCDDDYYYPNAFQVFHDHFKAHPDVEAMYASIDMTAVTSWGEKYYLREIIADEIKGSCCGGGGLDCQVDYLQLCHRATLLDRFPDQEYWPEDRAVIKHADGIFLEKIGGLVPIVPIRAKIGQNRKVPQSLNEGGERLDWLQRVHALEEANSQLRDDLARLQQEHQRLRDQMNGLRYRVADKVNNAIHRIPLLHGVSKGLLKAGKTVWQGRASK